MPTWQMALVFAVATGGALLLVPLAARVGAAAGLIDLPRPGEVQRRPVPRVGGYGIVAAFFLALAASLPVADRVTVSASVLNGLEEYRALARLKLGAGLLV